MLVYVTHPRSSERYEGFVAPTCPAKTVLDGLQRVDATDDGPFLDPAPTGRPYQLVHNRSQKQFNADDTMAALGVVDGDVLDVVQMGQGA